MYKGHLSIAGDVLVIPKIKEKKSSTSQTNPFFFVSSYLS